MNETIFSFTSDSDIATSTAPGRVRDVGEVPSKIV